jgi:hypothetical protein
VAAAAVDTEAAAVEVVAAVFAVVAGAVVRDAIASRKRSPIVTEMN